MIESITNRCATAVEAAAYADFSGLFLVHLNTKLSDKVAYICLDLVGRSIFEYLAFSAITELWLQTAFQASPTISGHFQMSLVVRSLNRVTGCVSVLLSGMLSLYLLVDTNTLAHIEQTELLFRLQIFTEALCWAVSAGFVAICIKITSERIITSFATFPPNDALERVALQCQALLPMGVCALAYAVRSFFLLCRLTGETTLFTATTRFHPVWWVVFVWAPTLLVVLCALYSARRRDRSVLDTDENHVPLLGTPVPPPAEAFANFRRFADGNLLSPFGGGPPSPVRQQQSTPSSPSHNHHNNNNNSPSADAAAGNDNLGDYTVV